MIGSPGNRYVFQGINCIGIIKGWLHLWIAARYDLKWYRATSEVCSSNFLDPHWAGMRFGVWLILGWSNVGFVCTTSTSAGYISHWNNQMAVLCIELIDIIHINIVSTWRLCPSTWWDLLQAGINYRVYITLGLSTDANMFKNKLPSTIFIDKLSNSCNICAPWSNRIHGEQLRISGSKSN